MSRQLTIAAESYEKVEWYLERLDGVEWDSSSKRGKAWCPVHGDEGSSMKGLSISAEGEKVLMYCHSAHCGAQLPQVHAALTSQTNGHVKIKQAKLVEAYDYLAEDGTKLFQVVRYEPKSFRQRRELNGRWVHNLTGVRRVLYNLPEVIRAIEDGAPVYVVEGEKDADALTDSGVVATCNPMGAGKWDDSYTESLRDADVIVVADRDATGREHARRVTRALTGVARSVRLVEALTGKDASDHLDAGHRVDEFLEVRVARSGAIDGASFVLDAPRDVPAVWGRGQEVAWAQGESLVLAGPQGVGKSTLMQQLALARIGIRKDALLFMTVASDDRPLLYIAADRPSQIQRSMARMVSEDDREALESRLHVWQGPLPFNLTTEPERFAPFVAEFGVGTVCIDSLKDVALDLSKDETGGRVNQALQETLACGIEVLVSHHQRKAQANNKKPTSLSDVYGSTWITAGAGSVLLLWGSPGDAVVELLHLKQPAEEIGPYHVLHDHLTGTTEVQPEFDVRIALKAPQGLSVKQAASKLFSTDDPDKNEVEKARRKLEGLVRAGEARVVERERSNGGKRERIYYLEGDLA